MTNGEKIREAFPNLEYEIKYDTVVTDIDNGAWFSLEWWNAEYKEPNKSEIPTGPTTNAPENNVGSIELTTKNDLGIDCISREQAIRELKESAEHHANDSREEALLRRDRDIIKALPSVTPIRPKGHWREVDTNMYACSECSHVLAIDPLVNSILEINTCPFCSVKMKGVIENERKID